GMGVGIGDSLLSNSSTPGRNDESSVLERVAIDRDRDRGDSSPADAVDAGGGEGGRRCGEERSSVSPLAARSKLSGGRMGHEPAWTIFRRESSGFAGLSAGSAGEL